MKRFILLDKEIQDSDLNTILQGFSETLGLFFSERDREKSCFRIFVEIIKAEKERDRLSSDEIANRANLSRATVIHHIMKLENTGLISSKRNRYFLAESSFESIIDVMEKDIYKIVNRLRKTARKLDKEIGFRRI